MVDLLLNRKKLLADSEDVVEFMVAMIDRAAREHPIKSRK